MHQSKFAQNSSDITAETNLNSIGQERDNLITAFDAAKYLSVSLPTFRSMVNSGQVKFYLINRRKKYKAADLDKLVQ
jgi:excisionase family DNA binding protein